MSETYLQTFRRYLATRTDAPKDFHLHAGLVTLGVALGNHVWCDGPARDIFPNLHSVILAPSGMGKSVPLDMASILLRKAGLAALLLPSSFSHEALLKTVAHQPVGAFILQEFAAFMALLSRDYNHGAMEDLTDLYDGSDLTRVLTKETITITRPALTLLGASSPDWFASVFSSKNLRGGYLARFLFCPSRAAGEPIGDPGPRDDGIEAILSGHLHQVADLHGKMNMDAARARLSEYGVKTRLAAREAIPDIAPMRSRALTMARKLAMLFHVSREVSLDVSDKDAEAAITFVEHTHDIAERYLMDEVARDAKDAGRLRLLEIVRTKGGECAWGVALKNSHMDARDFETAARTLIDSDQLLMRLDGRAKMLSLPEFAKFARTFANGANARNGSTHGEAF